MCLSPPRAALRVLAVMCLAARAQVYSQLRRLVSSWQHPTRPELPLFYTVAYDFRRDFYEQAGALCSCGGLPAVRSALVQPALLARCHSSSCHVARCP